MRISDGAACGAYFGRVIRGLDPAAKTPAWMARRLERAGLRPRSPLVDITNYVMLERGQPMHAFDHAKLEGAIDVRMARPGEELKLLTEQWAEYLPNLLLITDASGPVALGGVMGGFDSMVTDATTEVFFEAAYFAPEAIQGRAKALQLTSDAAYRFERGVDFAGTRAALERATELTLAICGGEAGPVTEAHGELPGAQGGARAPGARAHAAGLRRGRRRHGRVASAPAVPRWRATAHDLVVTRAQLALRPRHRGGLRRGGRARARLRARAGDVAALQRADAARRRRARARAST